MNLKRITPIILLLCLAGCHKSPRHDVVINDIAVLHKDGRHEDCVRQGRAFLAENRKRMVNKGLFPALADMYRITAECSLGKGDADGTVDILQEKLAVIGGRIPLEDRAEIEMQIGRIYQTAGRYTKAIAAYEHVAAAYAESFPDRFAGHARASATALMVQRVAEVTGHVRLDGRRTHQGIHVRVFNGMEESETHTDANGEFRAALYSSTTGTTFVVSATADGYIPFLEAMTFDGRMDIPLGAVKLRKIQEDSTGVLAGMVFRPVDEGIPGGRHGIAELSSANMIVDRLINPGPDGTGKRIRTIPVKSDDSGFFVLALPPGHYRLSTPPAPMVFTLADKEVRLVFVKHASEANDILTQDAPPRTGYVKPTPRDGADRRIGGCPCRRKR